MIKQLASLVLSVQCQGLRHTALPVGGPFKCLQYQLHLCALQVVAGELQCLLEVVLASSHSAADTCSFVDLDLVKGLPIMPTLSGWLLQYPVIYLADRQTADPLARLLTDSVLILYQVQSHGVWVQVSRTTPAVSCH